MPDGPARLEGAAAMTEEAVRLGGGVGLDRVDGSKAGEAGGAVAGEVELPVIGTAVHEKA